MNFMEVRVCVNTKNGKNVYCKLHQIIKPKEFRRFVDDTPLLKKKKKISSASKRHPQLKGLNEVLQQEIQTNPEKGDKF